jgi:hypothetical protein
VSVRGWHTDRFSPATLDLSPEIFRFHRRGPRCARCCAPWATGPLVKVLCLPNLPSQPGVGPAGPASCCGKRAWIYVVLFPTMLRELIRHVEVSKNYERSDLLQTLRILKNYELLKDEQLELFRRKSGCAVPSPARNRTPHDPDARPYIGLNMMTSLGPVRVRNLITALGAPEAVFTASEEELRRAEGIGVEVARSILDQRAAQWMWRRRRRGPARAALTSLLRTIPSIRPPSSRFMIRRWPSMCGAPWCKEDQSRHRRGGHTSRHPLRSERGRYAVLSTRPHRVHGGQRAGARH